MGRPTEWLAKTAFDLAVGGIDMIKDDHSLANQEFAPFRERVERCAEAVRRANERTGANAIYMPSLNAPYPLIERRLHEALQAGAGGLLVLPGVTGYDLMRDLAQRDEIGVPIMAHPAFLGSYSASPTNGIEHGTLYGKMMRLAGADLSVFPNYGGRFTFGQNECRRVAAGLAEPIPGIAPAMPAPGGGMTLDRVDEIKRFYGNDVALLIGGDLHRGDDLTATAAAFRAAIET
jgi:ribulose-bisphosphate carboxylase large chain